MNHTPLFNPHTKDESAYQGTFSYTHAYKHQLPIFEKRVEILECLKSNQVLIVHGETGSGKTTHLPLFCLEALGNAQGRIVCTQPRRIAAVSLALYVSDLLLSKPGDLVGYKVRFNEKCNQNTRIVFATDGYLLAEMRNDPLLLHYNFIIIDEAHERSLSIDFLLGYLRILLKKRSDLRLIISSATLETHLFSRCFQNAPCISVSGRLFPIKIRYKPLIEMWEGEKMSSYLDCVIKVIREIIDTSQSGDILVFLPTVSDIIETVNRLTPCVKDTCAVYSLFSRMTLNDQRALFMHRTRRTIIIATNIAETSITVPRIAFVVDTGLVRTLRWDPELNTSRMPIERISRSSAQQRAGRCGRVREGECIRLFSESDFNNRPLYTTAEIKRANLAGVILRMHALHLGSIKQFPFLQRPTHTAIHDGYLLLRQLGAINKHGVLTQLGTHMSLLPLDPVIACMILHAVKVDAVYEVMVIAAALSVVDPRQEHATDSVPAKTNVWKRLIDPESDFITYVNIWNAWEQYRGRGKNFNLLQSFCDTFGLSFHRMREWIDVFEQITRIYSLHIHTKQKLSSQKTTAASIHKSIMTGLLRTIAIRQENGLYRSAYEHDIMLWPGSTLKEKQATIVLFHQIIHTKRIYGRTAAVIKAEWIQQVYPQRCTSSYDSPWYDQESGTVRGFETVMFEGLPIITRKEIEYGTKMRTCGNELFIEHALIQEKLGDSCEFLIHNRQVCQTLKQKLVKIRSAKTEEIQFHLYSWYKNRCGLIVSRYELKRLIQRKKGDSFLKFAEIDLLQKPLDECFDHLPDHVYIGSTKLAVHYVFDVHSSADGASITLPLTLYHAIPLYYWQWMLPCFVQKRIECMCEYICETISASNQQEQDKTIACCFQNMSEMEHGSVENSAHPYSLAQLVEALPIYLTNAIRYEPVPFLTVARRVLQPVIGQTLYDACERALMRKPYLWMRITVVNERGEEIESFREPMTHSSIHQRDCAKVSYRVFPEVYAHVLIHPSQHVQEYVFGEQTWCNTASQLLPFVVYSALWSDSTDDSVSLCPFFSYSAAKQSHCNALMKRAQTQLSATIAWNLQQVRLPVLVLQKWRTIRPEEEVIALFHNLMHLTLFELPENPVFDSEFYSQYTKTIVTKTATVASDVTLLMEEMVNLLIECKQFLDRKTRKKMYSFLTIQKDDLLLEYQNYVSLFFDETISMRLIRQIPRYVRGFHDRIECAFSDPVSYKSHMRLLKTYQQRLDKRSNDLYNHYFSYRYQKYTVYKALEEFKIILFSAQKKQQVLENAQNALAQTLKEYEALSMRFDQGDYS